MLTPLEKVLAAFPDAKQTKSNQWEARCPAHDDNRASLSIGLGEKGGTVLRCFAGCSNQAVVYHAGLTMSDLMPPRTTQPIGTARRIVRTYPYTDEAGKVLFEVVRYEPKDFRQRQPDNKGSYVWNLKGVRMVLYRLPQVLAATKAGQTVFLVEGEKDVESLESLGLVATTNAGGAQKWRTEYTETLRGAHVVLLPDNDPPGRQHMERVAAAISSVAASVRLLNLPELAPKGDISDWLKAGGTAEKLKTLAAATPLWNAMNPLQQEVGTAKDGALLPPTQVVERRWPEPLHKDAFHGLAGRICRAIEPHTESDIAAVLLSLLTMFGNIVGRSAFYRVEATQHFPNLFTCVVGSSSSGRKGTSLGYVRALFAEVDPDWTTDRIQGGLSSGEGFIYAVRDDRPEGNDDKRLLVIEPELASVLQAMERQGNTVSAKIRDAWDTGNLSTLTRHDPLKATDAHVSIIAQITPEELTRLLRATETVNGFANRFLFVSARRSKLLPDGGNFTPEARTPLVEELREAVQFVRNLTEAKPPREVTRDPEARTIWHAVYKDLVAEVPGLLGSVTSRAAPQVLRLSLIYALLDQSTIIRPEHLRAALAVWKYCEASAAFIFGDAMGDPLADEILAALRQRGDKGMTRTELRDLFARNKSAGNIGTALESLQKAGRATRGQRETDGRPAEVWFAVSPDSLTTETTETTKAPTSTSSSTPSVVSVVSVVPEIPVTEQDYEDLDASVGTSRVTAGPTKTSPQLPTVYSYSAPPLTERDIEDFRHMLGEAEPG